MDLEVERTLKRMEVGRWSVNGGLCGYPLLDWIVGDDRGVFDERRQMLLARYIALGPDLRIIWDFVLRRSHYPNVHVIKACDYLWTNPGVIEERMFYHGTKSWVADELAARKEAWQASARRAWIVAILAVPTPT